MYKVVYNGLFVQQCEKELDVFSIALTRNQAEVEFARQQKEKAKSGGFFSFFRGKKSESAEKGGYHIHV